MSKYQIYIGTYTNSLVGAPQSEGIYRVSLDGESGKFRDLELVAEVKNPSFVALARDSCHLYAVCDVEGSAVAAWQIDDDGVLCPLLHELSGGAGACHLSIDATGRNVLVAHYGDGSVASLPILQNGALGRRRTLIRHVGSGPNPRRQEKPHAHSIYCDEQGRFIYACDLGTDEILIYALDAARGTFSPAASSPGRVPAGGGPRHLALHPRGYAYVNSEMGMTVTAFSRDFETGALTSLQTIDTLPPGAPANGVSTAEIALHPGGKWLYVSNRGHESIVVFEVGEDGRLTLVEHVATPAEPRGFGISHDGKWLVVGGQKAHQIAAFKIDSHSGKLAHRGENLAVGTPVCIVFAP